MYHGDSESVRLALERCVTDEIETSKNKEINIFIENNLSSRTKHFRTSC